MKDISKYLIKRTLFLIITIFIIGTLHQCAKAYTIEEFEEYLVQVQNYNISSDARNLINWYFTNRTTILNKIGNTDNYTTFFLNYRYTSGTYGHNDRSIVCIEPGENYVFDSWSSVLKVKNYNSYKIVTRVTERQGSSSDSNWWNESTSSTSYLSTRSICRFTRNNRCKL